MNQREQRERQEGTFYCRVDQALAIQDYSPQSACIRLTGIELRSFNNGDFNSKNGCQTFLVDIGLSDLALAIKRTRSQWPPFHPSILWELAHICLVDDDLEIRLEDRLTYWLEDAGRSIAMNGDSIWIEVRYTTTAPQTSASYFYRLFGTEQPTYIELLSVDLKPGPALLAAWQPAGVDIETCAKDDWILSSFHVGQGMCALLRTEATSFLLDAGAGTPIKRDAYQAATGATLVNELRGAIAALPPGRHLDVVLSHADSDHWRLLDWDPQLLDRVRHVFLPSGQPELAFSAPEIRPKVRGLSTSTLAQSSSGASKLDVFRSTPQRSVKNTECLVAQVDINRRSALLPGDYAYEGMAHDKNSSIQALVTNAYDAVVVPHHGDRHSANNPVKASNPGSSIAFFSAGNHRGYRHPRDESLIAHDNAGFKRCSDSELAEIREQRLLP